MSSISKIYVPEKLKIQYQKRENTINGKLSFITYYDEKGKLRFEKSFNNWTDPKLGTDEVDNRPVKGFSISEGVKHDGGSFGSPRENVRIFDPRGYEFEISVGNFMDLLNHSDVIGKTLTQECVFAWHDKQRLLLPTNSIYYQDIVSKSKKRKNKISVKDLVVGQSYSSKKSVEDVYYYLGAGNINISGYSFHHLSKQTDFETYFNSLLEYFDGNGIKKFFNVPTKEFFGKSKKRHYFLVSYGSGDLRVETFSNISDRLEEELDEKIDNDILENQIAKFIEFINYKKTRFADLIKKERNVSESVFIETKNYMVNLNIRQGNAQMSLVPYKKTDDGLYEEVELTDEVKKEVLDSQTGYHQRNLFNAYFKSYEEKGKSVNNLANYPYFSYNKETFSNLNQFKLYLPLLGNNLIELV